ncbi:MAG: dTMP kinase [Acidiferrobacterales bacterium]|nr:dTMP kinase [Acidiferrobacterales bacterium]
MSQIKRGKFLTIEGQDGAGKSTNIEVVESFLDKNSIDYVKSREPGGTTFGETLRELLLNSNDDNIGDSAELLLIFAARAQHLQEVIEPALTNGQWVLCDRFTDATYAYQGFGRGLSLSVIEQLESTVQDTLRPDLTLLLDLPVELGESRAGQRSTPDRFEQQQQSFKQKVRDGYLQLANQHPDRIKTIDASQSIAEVANAIGDVLNNFLKHLD